MFVFTIKNLRKRKHITLKDLSQKTNLSTSYLSRLENNKISNCSLKALETIALALKTNSKKLFYDKSDIKILEQKLKQTIDKYGPDSKEALKISHIINLITNV